MCFAYKMLFLQLAAEPWIKYSNKNHFEGMERKKGGDFFGSRERPVKDHSPVFCHAVLAQALHRPVARHDHQPLQSVRQPVQRSLDPRQKLWLCSLYLKEFRGSVQGNTSQWDVWRLPSQDRGSWRWVGEERAQETQIWWLRRYNWFLPWSLTCHSLV